MKYYYLNSHPLIFGQYWRPKTFDHVLDLVRALSCSRSKLFTIMKEVGANFWLAMKLW